mmetsp:Transcript_39024/g.45491  ORF Transcript_39024/g.45491 Transcript_39024/m.45491 type:complete len:156 (-) Transcript_39024:302-769(-)
MEADRSRRRSLNSSSRVNCVHDEMDDKASDEDLTLTVCIDPEGVVKRRHTHLEAAAHQRRGTRASALFGIRALLPQFRQPFARIDNIYNRQLSPMFQNLQFGQRSTGDVRRWNKHAIGGSTQQGTEIGVSLHAVVVLTFTDGGSSETDPFLVDVR